MPKKWQVIYLTTFNEYVAIVMLMFASRFQIPERYCFSPRFVVVLAQSIEARC